jgi:competence protein ComEA
MRCGLEEMPSRARADMDAARPRSLPRRVVGAGLLALGLATWGPSAARPAPASAPAIAGAASAPSQKAAPAKPAKLVDINGASRAELKKLPGIGDAEADRIIAGRPYLSKADLATKNVLPTGVYLSLKNQIIAIQKKKTKAGAQAP